MRRFVPHLHTFSTLRSAGLLHPQYRFIPLHSASYVPLHSSRIMSVALYFFSGCSFAQPSGLAPLREKRHFALNQGTPPKRRMVYIFSPPFHARSTSLHFARATFHSRPAVAVRLPQPRHCAPRKIIISTIVTLIIFCSAWGCLIAISIRTLPKMTKQQHPSSKKNKKRK